jgi:hypothetical protein
MFERELTVGEAILFIKSKEQMSVHGRLSQILRLVLEQEMIDILHVNWCPEGLYINLF